MSETYGKAIENVIESRGHSVMVRSDDRAKAIFITDQGLHKSAGCSSDDDILCGKWDIIPVKTEIGFSDAVSYLTKLPEGFVMYRPLTMGDVAVIKIRGFGGSLYLEANILKKDSKDFLYNIDGTWLVYDPSVDDMVCKNWKIIWFDDYLRKLIKSNINSEYGVLKK